MPRSPSEPGLRRGRRRLRTVQPGPGDRRRRAQRAADDPVDAPVPRAAAAVRLAPRHAHRGRDDAGVVPQGPRHAAEPDQRLQLSVLSAQCGPADRLHQPEVAVPAARRVPRLPGVGGGQARPTWCATATRSIEVDAGARRTAWSTCFDVTARHGADTTTYRARNLVFGIGLEPHLPDGATLSDRVWHNQRPARPRRAAATSTVPAAGPVRGRRRRAERRRGHQVPARPLPARRGVRGVLPLRLQPVGRQPVRQPGVRPGRGRPLLRRAGRGQADDPRLPRQHELLGRRHRPHRGAVPARPTRRRCSARSGCGCSTCPGWRRRSRPATACAPRSSR